MIDMRENSHKFLHINLLIIASVCSHMFQASMGDHGAPKKTSLDRDRHKYGFHDPLKMLKQIVTPL